MTVLAIGDIGTIDGMFHIGDEAMFDAALGELRARGLEVTAISSAPAESQERYGVPALPRLGFHGLDRTAALARRAELVAAVRGESRLRPGDPAAPVVAAWDRVTGLLNAGGGNLASRWPVHLFERGTLVAMARACGIPVVFSGQTLGPDLTPADAAWLREAVSSASLVGARESRTARLLEKWGVPARLLVDDASFLSPADPPSGPVGVLVSMSGWYGGLPAGLVEQRVGRLIDRIADVADGPVVFHAHFGDLSPMTGRPHRGDELVHERVRAHVGAASTVAPTGTSAEAVALARRAGVLISSRYHPAVFAAPAGVPVIGLAADKYTRIKLAGVLGHWGQSDVHDLAELDRVTRTTEEMTAGATRARDSARERYDAHRAASTAWWDDVADAFGA